MFTWNWENYLIGKESAEICVIVNMFPTLCVRHTVGSVTVKILCDLLCTNF